MHDVQTQIHQDHLGFLEASQRFIQDYFPELTHREKVFLVAACMTLAFPERKGELLGTPEDYFDFATARIAQLIADARRQAVQVPQKALDIYSVNFQELFDERGKFIDPTIIIKDLIEVGVLKAKDGQLLILGKFADGIIDYGECSFLLEAGTLLLEFNGLRYSRILSTNSDPEVKRYIANFPHGIFPVINQQIINQIGDHFVDEFVHVQFNFLNELIGVYACDQKYHLFHGDRILHTFDDRPHDCFFSDNFAIPSGYVITGKDVYYFVQGELVFDTMLANYNPLEVHFSYIQIAESEYNVFFWGRLERNSAEIPFMLSPIESLPKFGAIQATHQFLHYKGEQFGRYDTEEGVVFSFGGKLFKNLRGELITEFIPNPDFEVTGNGIVKTQSASFPICKGSILTTFRNERVEHYFPIESAHLYEHLTGWVVTNLGTYLVLNGGTIIPGENQTFHYDMENPPQVFIDQNNKIYFVGHVVNEEQEQLPVCYLAGVKLIVPEVTKFRDLYVSGNGGFKCILDTPERDLLIVGVREEDKFHLRVGNFDAKNIRLVGFQMFGEYVEDGKLHPYLGQEMVARIAGLQVDEMAIIDDNTSVVKFHTNRQRGLRVGDQVLYESEQYQDFTLSSVDDGTKVKTDFSFKRAQINHKYGFSLYY